MSSFKALRNNEDDNVATVFESGVTRGSRVEVTDPKGEKKIIEALGDIPFGHKIAVSLIKSGETIKKYGEEIGKSLTEIHVGQHVHVHNIESIRGRGDWGKGGGA